MDIILNGISTGISFGNPSVVPATVPSSAFNTFNNFALSGLLDGTNTIAFKVQDVSSITGFRAELETVPIPTPALLPGLIGLGAAAWRKRKQGAAQEV